MHRRLWLVVGAAAAVVVVAASASATTTKVTRSAGAQSAAAPFAQAWAQVPRTTAGRKAKSILVFGEEQDVNGFNTVLSCCNQLAGGFLGANEALHGAFIQNNKGVWVKDIVSSASATSKTLTYTIRPGASWYWGGKKIAGHVQGLRLHAPEDRRPCDGCSGPDRLQQPRSGSLHPQGQQHGHLQVEDDELHVGLPVRTVRQLAEHVLVALSVGGTCRPGLQQDLDQLHLR